MNTKSKDRVVAFIDVLGWTTAFETEGHDQLVRVASALAETRQNFSPARKEKMKALAQKIEQTHGVAQVENDSYYDLQFSFVSDCFVVSVSPMHLKTLLDVTQWACVQLLGDFGFLTRGAITVGRFTHNAAADIAVGAPLCKAVQLEKETRFPRIEITPAVLDIARAQSLSSHRLYHDGYRTVLNIAAGAGDDWLTEFNLCIQKNLDTIKVDKHKDNWRYMAERLSKMAVLRA